MIRIGFWGIQYYYYKTRSLQNTFGMYLGPYSTVHRVLQDSKHFHSYGDLQLECGAKWSCRVLCWYFTRA